MTHEVLAAPLQRGDHRIDFVRRREEDQQTRSLFKAIW
jgi:hypothetical protein